MKDRMIRIVSLAIALTSLKALYNIGLHGYIVVCAVCIVWAYSENSEK